MQNRITIPTQLDGAERCRGLAVERADLVRIGIVAMCGVASFFALGPRFGAVDVAAVGGVLVGIYPILKEALSALAERRMTMELSMVIAVLAAAAIGEFLTAVIIVLFVLIAEILEHLTVDRGRRAIAELIALLPQTADVRRGGEVVSVSANALAVGDTVVVKPGARLPVDGIVTAGHSFIDQSTVTGESTPSEKVVGSSVFAGTINQSGTLDVRAERIGRDTAYGRIIESVEQAEQSRAPIQRIADRLAAYLVYFALGSAALTSLLTQNLRSTISVIVVAGACGIAAGTPLAIVGAIGQAAREGAIIKGGRYLELLAHIDTVVLDKTGTLTLGRPQVVAVHPYEDTSAEMLVATAASAEKPSEHPFAHAIIEKARDFTSSTDPLEFQSTPGGGVVASVDGAIVTVGNLAFVVGKGILVPDRARSTTEHSRMFVGRGGRYIGAIDIADVLRAEAPRAVAELRALGLRTVLLTGDAERIARSIASELGVDDFAAELLPEDKLERVRGLMSAGHCVAMVGDGINDAPALTQASVGIAMGSGTALTRETADVLLLGDNLETLVTTLRLARRCRRTIMQNFWGTLVVDGAGVAVAAVGLLNPLLAAFIHVASELAFIVNSARLLPGRQTTARVPADYRSENGNVSQARAVFLRPLAPNDAPGGADWPGSVLLTEPPAGSALSAEPASSCRVCLDADTKL